jgi:hypothetical protein
MRNFLMAGFSAAVLVAAAGALTPASASPMPNGVAPAAAAPSDVVEARWRGGRHFGWNRGRHHGWAMGRHRGWRHHR